MNNNPRHPNKDTARYVVRWRNPDDTGQSLKWTGVHYGSWVAVAQLALHLARAGMEAVVENNLTGQRVAYNTPDGRLWKFTIPGAPRVEVKA